MQKLQIKIVKKTNNIYIRFSACHSAEDGEDIGKRRKKRQANTVDADRTRILRQYFTNCLRSGVSFGRRM